MITKIINGKIINDGITEGKSLYIKDGVILDLTEYDLPADNVIDAENNFVSAGFIDIHNHGGGGHSVKEGAEATIKAAKLHYKHGTTTIFPTTSACSHDDLKFALEGIRTVMDAKDTDIPHIYGAHLEAPYFAPSQRGAQNPEYITNPIEKDYQEIINLFGGIIRRWSFAPELPGTEKFCKTLTENNIIPAIAHSDALYEDVAKIYDCGCKLVTHLYSGTSMVTRKDAYRYLGVVESAYLIDDMAVEVIADGHHLPAELLRLIYKIKGPDKICIVTDASSGAGLADGEQPAGAKYIIENGVAILPDRSSFAGSVATADREIRVMVKDAGIDISDAVKMMTETPARVMNIPKKGRLIPGYDADIVIFDDNINIKKVIRR